MLRYASTWWRHHGNIFPHYWPFVRGNHWSPVNFPHKGQWRGALIRSLICAWVNGWVNNHEASDLSRHCAHYDLTLMDEVYEVLSKNITDLIQFLLCTERILLTHKTRKAPTYLMLISIKVCDNSVFVISGWVELKYIWKKVCVCNIECRMYVVFGSCTKNIRLRNKTGNMMNLSSIVHI